MKFLCLCYYDVDALARLTPTERREIGEACAPHDAALRATGKVEAQGSLSLPDTWVHFVAKQGRPTMLQGPYLKGSRQVGAFFILEADSQEEAQAVASKHAAANYGEEIGFAVEVRRCDHFEARE